jgi:osmotically-inducible protein OsmY
MQKPHPPNSLLESDVKESLGWDLRVDKESLGWDLRVDSERIVVKADNGRIVLSGAVKTFDQVQRAVDDAWAVIGVKAVDDQLLVGPEGAGVADHDLAAACARALDGDMVVPKGSVRADVKDGFVVLFGEVRNHFQRKAADHAVGRLDGVLGVNDLITLTREPIPGDVAARIHGAFERNAFIDDSMIKVSKEGHTIYLDGTTNSYMSVLAAEDVAYDAPGVEHVTSRLTIVP